MKRKATPDESKHMGRVASLRCVVCGKPCHVHHCRAGSMGIVGAAMRSSHWLTIGLCHDHHQGANGIHSVGVETWERLYGKQTDHIDRVAGQLGVAVWEMAKIKPQRVYKRSSKICPRKGESASER